MTSVLSLPEAQEHLLVGQSVVVHESLMATLKSYFTASARERSPSIYGREDFLPGIVYTMFSEIEQITGKTLVYDTMAVPATLSLL